jgi:hypothetical protein
MRESPVKIARTMKDAVSDGFDEYDDTYSEPHSYAGLTRVCRQIRIEYLQMQRSESHILVNWVELGSYLDAFHGPKAADDVFPTQIRVRLGPMSPRDIFSHGSVDILPILVLCVEKLHLAVKFVEDWPRDSDAVEALQPDSGPEPACHELDELFQLQDKPKW